MCGRASRSGPQRRTPEAWSGHRSGLDAFGAHVLWRRGVRWLKTAKQLIPTQWVTIHHRGPMMTIGRIQTRNLWDRGRKWRNRKG